MRFKPLGNTDIQVSVIGQGTNIGGYKTPQVSYAEYQSVIRAGVDLGMNLIDTAPVYGHGLSEEAVGEAVKNIRDQVILATKVSPENVTRDGVIKSAEASLARLKTDHIDLYQVHWSNPTVPISETVGAMWELVKQGKVRHVGVSNFSMSELKQAEDASPGGQIVSNQAELNLFDRSVEEHLLPHCQREKQTLIAYSPLHRGRITSGSKRMEALQEIAREHGRTPAQVALRWLVSQEPVVAIPNTSNINRLQENAASADFDLSEEEISTISTVCAVRPELIPTQSIQVPDTNGQNAYRTVEEAIENRLNSVPSPVELAEQIRSEGFLKPVRIMRSRNGTETYELMEGRIRFWAWVIAHNGTTPIPALVEDTE
jgi:aryl-alcohol dehydrogenase-like predicted oxidoreductase